MAGAREATRRWSNSRGGVTGGIDKDSWTGTTEDKIQRS